MDKRKAYKGFKAAIRQLALSVEEMSKLEEKDLRWIEPRIEKVYKELDQRIENALSNIEKRSRGIKEKEKDPIDDLPF